MEENIISRFEIKTSTQVEIKTCTQEQVSTYIQQCLNNNDIEPLKQVLPQFIDRFPGQKSFTQLYQQLEQQDHVNKAKNELNGVEYLHWLEWFHTQIKPKTYMEIGVESGQSLRFANNPTISIGVDPQPKIIYQQDSWVKLFAMPSDDFFDTYDVKQQFNGQTIDLAFIDGLHTFDQALKDFINVEKNANKKTVALFHDIYPVTPITAERDRKTIFWLGDTWKVIPLIKSVRPDLNIFTIPTYPSGLAVITGLDPESTVLEKVHKELISQWMIISLDDHIDDIKTSQNVILNDEQVIKDNLIHDDK